MSLFGNISQFGKGWHIWLGVVIRQMYAPKAFVIGFNGEVFEINLRSQPQLPPIGPRLQLSLIHI